MCTLAACQSDSPCFQIGKTLKSSSYTCGTPHTRLLYKLLRYEGLVELRVATRPKRSFRGQNEYPESGHVKHRRKKLRQSDSPYTSASAEWRVGTLWRSDARSAEVAREMELFPHTHSFLCIKAIKKFSSLAATKRSCNYFSAFLLFCLRVAELALAFGALSPNPTRVIWGPGQLIKYFHSICQKCIPIAVEENQVRCLHGRQAS